MLPLLILAASATANTPAEPLPVADSGIASFSLRDGVAWQADDAAGAATTKKRDYLMEVNFRGRYMTIPGSFLDPFVSAHANDEYPKRPDINAYTLGLEFVVKNKTANGIFYLEYVNPLIKAGYWDDADHGSPDPLDGSWAKPNGLGVIALGADYAYEVHATNWLSFLFGAGLGFGYIFGNIEEWQPGEDPEDPSADNNNYDPSCGVLEPAYQRKDECHYDDVIVNDGSALVSDSPIPPVIVFVDINVSVRFNINDRADIRLEGGLHDFLYGGAAVGVTF